MQVIRPGIPATRVTLVKKKTNCRMNRVWHFWRLPRKGDAAKLQLLLNNGAPANFVDPVNHATALHYAAAYAARPALGVLLSNEKCDFLIRDWEGRLPSEIAREYGRDREMAHRLLIKEMRQARAQGIDPDSLYKISARKPAR